MWLEDGFSPYALPILDIGHWTLDIGHWTLDLGFGLGVGGWVFLNRIGYPSRRCVS